MVFVYVMCDGGVWYFKDTHKVGEKRIYLFNSHEIFSYTHLRSAKISFGETRPVMLLDSSTQLDIGYS